MQSRLPDGGQATEPQQWAAGLCLLAFGALALIVAIRDFVWLARGQHATEIEPAVSGAVILASPWLLRTGYLLLRGRLKDRPLLPPLGLVLTGLGLSALGIWVAKQSPADDRVATAILTAGVGGIVLGTLRWWAKRRRAPGSMNGRGDR